MFLGGVIDIQTGNVLAMLKPGAASLKHSECLQAGSTYRTLIRMRAKQLKRLSRSIN